MPIRAELRHFYQTPEWKAVRGRVRDRAGDRCEDCGAPNRLLVLRCYKWWTPSTLETTLFLMQATKDDKFVTELPWHHRETVRVAHFPWHDRMHYAVIQCGAAHLNNRPGDDRPENIAWLCRGCHLHRDRDFHRETRATRKDAARPLLSAAGFHSSAMEAQ